MRLRPWPIIALAFCQLLAPFVDLVMNAWLMGTSPKRLFLLYLEFYPPLQHFQTFGLPLFAAVSVYAVKIWSYPVFLGITAWNLHLNIRNWIAFQGSADRLVYIFISLIINVLFVSYFLIPAVRATYLNYRLRWWEPKPRYEVDFVGELRSARGRGRFKALDISEGGMFIHVLGHRKLQLDQRVLLKFGFSKLTILLLGKVVHHSKIRMDGYGVQFIELESESRDQLRRLMKSLELLGFRKRQARNNWRQDLADWLATLIVTGQGWVPRVPSSQSKQIPQRPKDPLKLRYSQLEKRLREESPIRPVARERSKSGRKRRSAA